MQISALHRWTQDPDEAVCLQESLRSRVVLSWDGRPVNSLAGVDVSYSSTLLWAAIAIFSFPELKALSTYTAEAPLRFPYLPGLLAFRVLPAILTAWESLPFRPDVLLIHGHGIAHPRGFGLASHLGLWLDLPAIGVARSILYGHHPDPGPTVGEWSEVTDEASSSHIIGAALRTRLKAKPIYVSAGHLIDLPQALELVSACCGGHRLPEPLRLAHRAAASLAHGGDPGS